MTYRNRWGKIQCAKSKIAHCILHLVDRLQKVIKTLDFI